jgi:serine/threonine protein kinase
MQTENETTNTTLNTTNANETDWTVDNFEIGECLGNGKFGYVYRAVEKVSRKTLAIKIVCKNTINQYNFFDQLRKEIEIHSRLMYLFY